jgi:hypothetical protein
MQHTRQNAYHYLRIIWDSVHDAFFACGFKSAKWGLASSRKGFRGSLRVELWGLGRCLRSRASLLSFLLCHNSALRTNIYAVLESEVPVFSNEMPMKVPVVDATNTASFRAPFICCRTG